MFHVFCSFGQMYGSYLWLAYSALSNFICSNYSELLQPCQVAWVLIAAYWFFRKSDRFGIRNLDLVQSTWSVCKSLVLCSCAVMCLAGQQLTSGHMKASWRSHCHYLCDQYSTDTFVPDRQFCIQGWLLFEYLGGQVGLRNLVSSQALPSTALPLVLRKLARRTSSRSKQNKAFFFATARNANESQLLVS